MIINKEIYINIIEIMTNIIVMIIKINIIGINKENIQIIKYKDQLIILIINFKIILMSLTKLITVIIEGD